jgi:hypothetical protein
MSWLSKLFGGGGDKAGTSSGHPSEVYKDFTITPTPIREGSRYRISARIEKGDKVHTLIRADTIDDEAVAAASSLSKAKQAIDQLSDGIFD